MTFCWTGCLDTASLHQGKIDFEKNYRKVSCLACVFSPASPQEACLHGPHTPVTVLERVGGVAESLRHFLQAATHLPGPQGAEGHVTRGRKESVVSGRLFG